MQRVRWLVLLALVGLLALALPQQGGRVNDPIK
jgi:hypothetical protein